MRQYPPLPADIIAELRRELAARGRVYVQQVSAGKLSEETGNWRCACLHEAIRIIEIATCMEPKIEHGKQLDLMDAP